MDNGHTHSKMQLSNTIEHEIRTQDGYCKYSDQLLGGNINSGQEEIFMEDSSMNPAETRLGKILCQVEEALMKYESRREMNLFGFNMEAIICLCRGNIPHSWKRP